MKYFKVIYIIFVCLIINACDTNTIYYYDADGDGYGNPNNSIQINSQETPPTGYIKDNTDCDDTHETVHPGAIELYDGIDNQCPNDSGYGEIDEDVRSYCFYDIDDDGYGDPENSLPINFGEAPPPRCIEDSTDCNDNNNTVYPGANELCDGIDNQCPTDIGYGEIDENTACPSGLQSIRLNGVELIGLETVPMAAINLDGNSENEICLDVPENESDNYSVIIEIYTGNGKYREILFDMGYGNSICKTDSIPVEQSGSLYNVLRTDHNIEVIKGSTYSYYNIENNIEKGEVLFSIDLEDTSYHLSNSTLSLPLYENYKGIKIYSDAKESEKIDIVKDVIDSINTSILSEMRKIYIFSDRDMFLGAWVFYRAIEIKDFDWPLSDNQRLLNYKAEVFHELVHIYSYWKDNDCFKSECPEIHLDSGNDPKFFTRGSFSYLNWNFSKLAGGYPTNYATIAMGEYLAEVGAFAYRLYLSGEQINIEHISPNLKSNIDTLMEKGYFLSDWIDAFNAPVTLILPVSSAYRLFSSDFPLSEFNSLPPDSVIPRKISIDETTIYENGEQYVTSVQEKDTYEICFDQIPAANNEFYNNDLSIILVGGSNNIIGGSGTYILKDGLYCCTAKKTNSNNQLQKIIFRIQNKIVDQSQFYYYLPSSSNYSINVNVIQ